MLQKSLSELASFIGGNLIGNADVLISGVAPIQSATESDITFLEKAERTVILKDCKAGCVIIPTGAKLCPEIENFPVIQVENVLESFKQIVLLFSPQRDENVHGIGSNAVISPSAVFGENAAVGHCAVIEDEVQIGDNVVIHSGVQIKAGSKIGSGTVIFSNAVLYRNTQVGERCVIHSNSVIGAFGFGYDSSSGQHKLSPQLGNVVIGNDVEIGSCSTVDRATYGSTIIGDGTKIDNLVMIGHNCKLGRYNLICAHTGIAGSTTTGDYVVMAGRVGVKDHVHIGSGAVLGAMSGILASVPENARLVGIPATPEKEQMRIQVALHRLPELQKEFKKMSQEIESLKALLKDKT
ncbi:UDP-3-O-acylglucosamine N-acyltransferase [Planctomycetales bacterium]|nr:UDP-3-O-acylglucosamine N-acyltransferase [Planctomycetales bacterium]GHT34909.1 UDP-3-O-acylglucosamine N-acyltransferase [Planctomycetales bacterium]